MLLSMNPCMSVGEPHSTSFFAVSLRTAVVFVKVRASRVQTKNCKRSLIEDHLRNAPSETECAANRVEKGLGERLGEVCLEQSDNRPCVVLQKQSTIRLEGAKGTVANWEGPPALATSILRLSDHIPPIISLRASPSHPGPEARRGPERGPSG